MSTLYIGAASLNQTPFDWQQNTSNILTAISEAQKQGVELLCLPELCITGYGCEDVFFAHWLQKKAMDVLLSIVPHTINITVSIGLPVQVNGSLYNCACLVSNGQILGFTAKQFLANDGVHYEPRWFTPWKSGERTTIEIEGSEYAFGDVTYQVLNHHIGFEICEDAWRPTRPADQLCERGVDIILNPSASHFAFGKTTHRKSLVVDSSRKYDCTYVYTNLCGNEAGRLIFDGEILIAHKGTLISRQPLLRYQSVQLITATIHPSTGEKAPQRTKEEEFKDAVCLGLFDYLRKSRSKSFVLSLSGGADSSACAVLVYLMIQKGISELGVSSFLKAIHRDDLLSEATSATNPCNTICKHLLITAYQSTSNSGDATYLSAKELAESIGATFHNWSVDDQVESYKTIAETAIGRSLTWETDDITLQNIQARTRAPIIWMFANIYNGLLLTTSNRSEGDVGYATMDGDTAGSLAPIAGVDKVFVRKWLVWAEKNLGITGLQRVNAMAPTAELRPTERAQTDEKDLMPYELLESIERLMVEQRLSPTEIYSSLENTFSDKEQLKTYIKRYFTLWTRNQWKRERLAPAFHLDTFNVDPKTWCRFPILSGGFMDELNLL